MIDKFLDIKSIDPMYWGKNGWIFLNSIAITYKPEKKQNYKIFIEQLVHVLPCKTCGENLRKNLNTLDDALISKESLLNWLLNIRNEVYVETGRTNYKKTLKDSFDEVFYDTHTNYTLYILLITSIIIFVLLIILLKNRLQFTNENY